MARRNLLRILADAQVPRGRRVPRCILCVGPVRYATIEHILPRAAAKGRWDWRSNKAVSCLGCNARKGDRMPTAAEMARFEALKAGDPEWYRRAPVPADFMLEPAEPKMVFKPARAGAIRLDVGAFHEVCADIRAEWDTAYPEHVRDYIMGLHGSYRAWLRLELADRRDEFILKEPEAGHAEARS